MPRSPRDETIRPQTQTPILVLRASASSQAPLSARVFPNSWPRLDRRPGGKGRSTNQFTTSTKETHMLWTILVIVVIVLAVIGLLSVLRGRA
jgi:hypothetical protein